MIVFKNGVPWQKLKVFSLKLIRTDNGKEFVNDRFNAFCKKGIKRQFTIPYSPQQNGVVERRNRTSIEMATSLICYAQLSKEFWGEDVNTSMHTLNCIPTKALQDKIP